MQHPEHNFDLEIVQQWSAYSGELKKKRDEIEKLPMQ